MGKTSYKNMFFPLAFYIGALHCTTMNTTNIKPVRKAVFPVAGLGTRFLPPTKVLPKEMLPLVDRPLIQRAVEEAQEAGIEEFIFVSGRGKSLITQHFEIQPELRDELERRDKLDILEKLNHSDIPSGKVQITMQQRGAAIIKARGASSAASAASAAIDHMRNWALGTDEGDWVSMAVPSDGSYGVKEGIIFGYPCTCKDGRYEIVQGLDIDEFSEEKIKATEAELREERDAVSHLFAK